MSQVTQAEEQPGSRRARGGRVMARGLKNPMISVAVNRLFMSRFRATDFTKFFFSMKMAIRSRWKVDKIGRQFSPTPRL